MIEKAVTPPWLAKDRLLAQFAAQREKAMQHYIQFIAQGIDQESIWKHLNRQVFLGDDNFIKRMQEKIKGKSDDINIPQVQRRSPAKPLAEIAKAHKNRDRAIVAAYTTGEYSYQDIGTFFNLHFTTVGNIVRANRAKKIKAGK